MSVYFRCFTAFITKQILVYTLDQFLYLIDELRNYA